MLNSRPARRSGLSKKEKIMSHRVYFIECIEYIKIGLISDSLESKLSVLQVGNPFKLKILGSISCDCDQKHPPTLRTQRTCKTESDIHAEFLDLQVKSIKKSVSGFQTQVNCGNI